MKYSIAGVLSLLVAVNIAMTSASESCAAERRRRRRRRSRMRSTARRSPRTTAGSKTGNDADGEGVERRPERLRPRRSSTSCPASSAIRAGVTEIMSAETVALLRRRSTAAARSSP